MTLKCLSLTSPVPFLVLLTIILLLYTSVAAIRLPPLDELNPSTAISKPPLIARRESTEHLPADQESSEPVVVVKKKPQVIRLGIKHEEHGTGYLPLPADQQPTTNQHSRRGQQNTPEGYYTQRLETGDRYEGQGDHPTSPRPHGILSREPCRQSTAGSGDGSPELHSHLNYDQKSSSQATGVQHCIHLSRRGLELVEGACFIPDPAGNKCQIPKYHCVTYDTGVGSEFGLSTGECWCPMMTAVEGPHSKREILPETEEDGYGNPQIHKRDLRRRGQFESENLFVYQPPNNMEQDPGFPKIYKREPEPLPARKKNKRKGDVKQTGKCKGGKCNTKQAEGKKKGKAHMNRRNAYMYHGDFELEL